MIKRLNNKGYTLIELMLAMGLFTVILVVSTIGFIGINRTYTRGVIKKELTESIQKLGSDIEAVVKVQPASSVVYCSEADLPADRPECTGQPFSVLCFSNTRYYWPSHTSGEGGLYRDGSICSSATFDKKTEIVNSRYVTEDLKITPLPSDLYQIQGIFHTINSDALTVDDNSGTYTDQRVQPGFDPYLTKCKGSAAGSVVQSCAVEKFNFVINSRGNQV